MKKSFLFLAIAGLHFMGLSEIQAQSAQTKLNQIELMKQFIGSWTDEYAKDTVGFWNAKPYGIGLECNYKSVTKGKLVYEGKQLWGYDKRVDKYIWLDEEKGKDIGICATWFISNNKYVTISYDYISDPEKVSEKIEGEFKSPDMYAETRIVNGKPVNTNTYTRIK